MRNSGVNPNELAEAKADAEATRKKAVDSLMAVIYQINPTKAGDATMRSKVEQAIDAIIEATGNRLSYDWVLTDEDGDEEKSE
ncbi:MAG: hypothetical protein MUO26_12570 [Methanotrichaceae archaeon]|nr:hypothetical protein [Methanotrichaceae archaeon]